MSLLVWAWAFTLPGLFLTAAGVPGGQRRAGWASLPGPILVLLVALFALVAGGQEYHVHVPGWLPVLPDGAFHLRADGLSGLLLAILGFVATVVYVYSLGYLADDPSRRRFFVYLDFFVAAMALLLLAGNLVVLLVGWTGVGIASFLLISFWRDRPGTLGAGMQALAANAMGDGALLLAAVLVPLGCGDLAELGTAQCTAGFGGAEFLAALIFVAAAAKSAQGPLYFWLPSAMAGPTPISALIHAATMVAAGVYLLVRTHDLLALAPGVAFWIAVIGVATALAASVASFLNANFKRAVAYSTVAQLGYMFAAVGVGAPFAALFHLITHAAFKALLFLSAGVVIHAANGEELLSRLGGMRRRVPFSHLGFLIGSLALIGVPVVTAGAYSKDAILEEALANFPLVGWLLLGGVFLTGLYVGRLYFGVYHGDATPAAVDTYADAHHAAEGNGHDPTTQRLLDWPLVPLMVAAVVFGFLAWPTNWLEGALGPGGPQPAHSVQAVSLVGLAAAALGLAGFGLAWWLTRSAPASIRGLVKQSGAQAATPRAAGWVDGIAGAGYAVAGQVVAIHSGRLAHYLLGSLVALAGILLLRFVVG